MTLRAWRRQAAVLGAVASSAAVVGIAVDAFVLAPLGERGSRQVVLAALDRVHREGREATRSEVLTYAGSIAERLAAEVDVLDGEGRERLLAAARAECRVGPNPWQDAAARIDDLLGPVAVEVPVLGLRAFESLPGAARPRPADVTLSAGAAGRQVLVAVRNGPNASPGRLGDYVGQPSTQAVVRYAAALVFEPVVIEAAAVLAIVAGAADPSRAGVREPAKLVADELAALRRLPAATRTQSPAAALANERQSWLPSATACRIVATVLAAALVGGIAAVLRRGRRRVEGMDELEPEFAVPRVLACGVVLAVGWALWSLVGLTAAVITVLAAVLLAAVVLQVVEARRMGRAIEELR